MNACEVGGLVSDACIVEKIGIRVFSICALVCGIDSGLCVGKMRLFVKPARFPEAGGH